MHRKLHPEVGIDSALPLLLFALASLVCGSTGCTNDHDKRTLHADVTSESTTSGRAVSRPASRRQVRDSEEYRRAIRAIDHDFPPHPLPTTAPKTFRAESVDSHGRVQLEEGPVVTLAGITCSQKGTGYLDKLLRSDNVRVAPVESVEASAKYVDSDLWIVDYSTVGETKVPGYTSVTEAALTSGWCNSLPSSDKEYRPRYEILEELGKHFQ